MPDDSEVIQDWKHEKGNWWLTKQPSLCQTMIKSSLICTTEIVFLSFTTRVQLEITTRGKKNVAWNNDFSLLWEREFELMPHRYVPQKTPVWKRKAFNLMGHLSSCLFRVSDAHHSGMWLQLEQKAFPVLKIIKDLEDYMWIIPGSHQNQL